VLDSAQPAADVQLVEVCNLIGPAILQRKTLPDAGEHELIAVDTLP
jgi:hypothetical protein